jgi:peptidoglycan lytic transglycosylase G
MKKGALALTLFVALLALACGFGGTTAALWVTQPAAPGAGASVNFVVQDGDNAAKVADRLQAAGLIRNAQLFKLLAKFRHLDTGIETGTYELTPGMTMDAIIAKLQTGKPDDIAITIPEARRVLQMPFRLRVLPKFNSGNFVKIVTTGKFLDGTAVSSQYWYVMPLQKNAAFALEGYLYPDTYRFLKTDDETVVIKRMLDEFGEQLCPGPADGKPDAYIHDQAQCKAHAVTVGTKKLNLFTALEQKYFVPSVAKNDSEALYDALTLGSIAMREIPSLNDAKDIQGITDVYYNRYLHILGKADSADLGLNLEADPTVQYARDTEAKPGLDGIYWAPLGNVDVNAVAATNAYNTYTQTGLPPGPISAPGWDVLKAAVYPNPDGTSPYWFFLNEVCKGNATHYAADAATFETLKAQYLDPAKCPKS